MVDPSKRLTIDDILKHDWLTGRVDVPSTPLLTPGILGNSRNQIEKAFKVALNAFHKVRTVTLMDVASAPLAKRRKLKHSNEYNSPRTSSSSSDKDKSHEDIPSCLNQKSSQLSHKRKKKHHETTPHKKPQQELVERLNPLHKFENNESLVILNLPSSNDINANSFSKIKSPENVNFISAYNHSSNIHFT